MVMTHSSTGDSMLLDDAGLPATEVVPALVASDGPSSGFSSSQSQSSSSWSPPAGTLASGP